MKCFLGIGLGPIQTGIFVSGAFKGGFDRIVIAEVDENVKNGINSVGGVISINIAAPDRVYTETYKNIEVYNPNVPAELEKLISAAADASEIATALPSVKFFSSAAVWLREGFRRKPQQKRFIYTAENDNHAAEKLKAEVAEEFPQTYYLNTVIGKMSDVAKGGDMEARKLAPLFTNADRAHLVEEFSWILISSAPGIEDRITKGLHVKNDLYPFEYAKLYGHNATHFLLGMLGEKHGLKTMSELSKHGDIVEFGRKAFFGESGTALCKKYAGVDELFTEKGFRKYVGDLIIRMQNPYLSDSIDRVIRDIKRKLSWDDRVVGTMRLAVSQGVTPNNFAVGALLAAQKEFGNDPEVIKKSLSELWQKPINGEAETIFDLIINAKI